MKRPIRILIVGGGAIGCFVGGTLAAREHDVTLVGRASTAVAVRERGLKLLAADGTARTIRSIRAVSSVQEAFQTAPEENGRDKSEHSSWHAPSLPHATQFDLAILAVKSYDTEKALDELAKATGTDALPISAILSLQNGVGNEEAISARFGLQQVLSGTVTAPVQLLEPGVVRVTKTSFAIGLAPWQPEPPGPAPSTGHCQQAKELFVSAGIPAKVYEDAAGMKWSKLLMNMIGNATSAILAEPPDITFADKRIANLEIDALREALHVMSAANIRARNIEKYPLAAIAPLLRFGPRALLRPALLKVVSGARGGKMPSLFLDLEAGKKGSEIGWYNGAIVRKGDQVGIDTPVNRLLTRTVRKMADDPQLRATWRGKREFLANAWKATVHHQLEAGN